MDHTMTDEQAELRRLHAQGLNDKEIGAALGHSRQWVGKQRKELDLPTNHDPAKNGRKGAAASPYAARKQGKAKGKPKGKRGKAAAIERIDTCDTCGMPFSLCAPKSVADRLHRLWVKKHPCAPDADGLPWQRGEVA